METLETSDVAWIARFGRLRALHYLDRMRLLAPGPGDGNGDAAGAGAGLLLIAPSTEVVVLVAEDVTDAPVEEEKEEGEVPPTAAAAAVVAGGDDAPPVLEEGSDTAPADAPADTDDADADADDVMEEDDTGDRAHQAAIAYCRAQPPAFAVTLDAYRALNRYPLSPLPLSPSPRT